MTTEAQGSVDSQDPRYIHYAGRRLLRVAGGENDGGPPAVPEPPVAAPAQPGPEAVPTPAPAAPPQAPAPASPWADGLAEHFPDEAVRGQVDEFLRGEVQPYVTRIEQDKPPAEALQLWEDLNEKPEETFGQIAAELFADDPGALTALRESLDNYYGEDGNPTAAAELEPGPAGEVGPAADPDLERVKEIVLTQEMEQEYEAAWDAVKQANPDQYLDDDNFHSFVVANEGDFEVAAEEWKKSSWPAYLKWQGEQAGTPDPNAIPEELPPAVLGEGGGGPTPPVYKQENLHEAVDGFFEDQSAAALPPVGSA